MYSEDYYMWYPYYEFPEDYEINRMGQFRNRRTNTVLNGSIRTQTGYLYVTLYHDGKAYSRAIHVCVANQFLPQEEGKTLVNHKDENKANPCLDNLEWVSHKENSNHGTAQKRRADKLLKPINEYNLEGKYIRTWKSIMAIVNFVCGADETSEFKEKRYNAFRVIIEKNKREENKRLICGRVFIPYEKDCNDLQFGLARNYSKNEEFIVNQINDNTFVVADYLFNPTLMADYYRQILVNYINENSLDLEIQEAIEYAIGYLEKK